MGIAAVVFVVFVVGSVMGTTTVESMRVEVSVNESSHYRAAQDIAPLATAFLASHV
jgi:hypothetical protein